MPEASVTLANIMESFAMMVNQRPCIYVHKPIEEAWQLTGHLFNPEKGFFRMETS